MSNSVYKMVLEFKERHPWTIGWRLKQNSKVVELHLNPDEKKSSSRVLFEFNHARYV